MINNDLIEQKVAVLIKSLEPVVDEIKQNKESTQERLMGIWYRHKERMDIERKGLLGIILEDTGLNKPNINESQQGEVNVISTVFYEKTENAINEFYKEKIKPIIFS